jgi:hypothetical protein
MNNLQGPSGVFSGTAPTLKLQAFIWFGLIIRAILSLLIVISMYQVANTRFETVVVSALLLIYLAATRNHNLHQLIEIPDEWCAALALTSVFNGLINWAIALTAIWSLLVQ